MALTTIRFLGNSLTASFLILSGCSAAPDEPGDAEQKDTHGSVGHVENALWQNWWFTGEKLPAGGWPYDLTAPPQVTAYTNTGCVAQGIGISLNKNSSGKFTSVRAIELVQACETNWPVDDGQLTFNHSRVRGGDPSAPMTVMCDMGAGNVLFGARVAVGPTANFVELEVQFRRYDSARGTTDGVDRWARCQPGRRLSTPQDPLDGPDAYVYPWANSFGMPPGGDDIAMTAFQLAVSNNDETYIGMAAGPLPVALPDIRFSEAGPIPGMHCASLNEPNDAAGTWGDNYICSWFDYGIQFSPDGPISGKKCVQMNEPAEPGDTGWDNNYICSGSQFVNFRWSYAGPISGLNCTAIYEHADPYTWGDNYLCY